jgi:DNA invertase Pin-like site-specific DNA recombinase
MVIGYARVSTEQQDTAGQLPDLKKAGCKRIYQETMGGGTLDRPELEKCLDRLETGDTLVVWRLDRLGRSIRNLLQIVDRLDKSGINFISLLKRSSTPVQPQAD